MSKSVLIITFLSIVFTGVLHQKSQANSIKLGLPIECEPYKDCWIVNYIDHDVTSRAEDYKCGLLTYDGSSGTDFSVRDTNVMKQGVNVIASADGVVKALRDGQKDRLLENDELHLVKGKECGNGVVLSHDDFWETQYCHLARGSITLKVGDKVSKGDTLGQVGLSGLTQFPHMELVVRHHGQNIDPFTGKEKSARCGDIESSLWDSGIQKKLEYRKSEITNIGIAPSGPEWSEIQEGRFHYESLPSTSPLFIVWAEVLGAEEGDELIFEVITPEQKKLMNPHIQIKKNQIQIFRYAGKKRKEETWQKGQYLFKATLKEKQTNKTLSMKEKQFFIK